jgi:hypothetical protein
MHCTFKFYLQTIKRKYAYTKIRQGMTTFPTSLFFFNIMTRLLLNVEPQTIQ